MILVLLSSVLERASATFGLAARIDRKIRGERVRTFVRAVIAAPFWIYPVAMLALSLTFSALIDRARALQGASAVSHDVPFDFLYLRDEAWHVAYGHVAPLVIAVVFLQSIVLAMLYLKARTRALTRADTAVVIAAVVAFVVMALRAHVLESTDMYKYVVYAHLGMAGSYATGIAIDDRALRRVTDLTWGVLPPSPYGPLWQIYNRAVANVPSLADATMRLRSVNAIVLIGLFGGLIAGRIPLAAVLILALNPYVYNQYVVNAHNDLVPIAALTLGVVFAARSRWFVIVAAAIAGLVKLPLLLVGLATFGAIDSLKKRITVAVAVVVLDLAISFALGGQPYVHALFYAADADRHESLAHVAVVARLAVVVLGAGAIGFMFFKRQQYWPGLRTSEPSLELLSLVPHLAAAAGVRASLGDLPGRDCVSHRRPAALRCLLHVAPRESRNLRRSCDRRCRHRDARSPLCIIGRWDARDRLRGADCLSRAARTGAMTAELSCLVLCGGAAAIVWRFAERRIVVRGGRARRGRER